MEKIPYSFADEGWSGKPFQVGVTEDGLPYAISGRNGRASMEIFGKDFRIRLEKTPEEAGVKHDIVYSPQSPRKFKSLYDPEMKLVTKYTRWFTEKLEKVNSGKTAAA